MKILEVAEHNDIEGTMEQREIGHSMSESDLGVGCVRGHVVASLARESLSDRETNQEALAAQSRGEQVEFMVDGVILWGGS
jgi:hypothetical protein